MFLDKRNLSSCVDPAALVDTDGARHTKSGLRRAIGAIAACAGMPPHPPPLELTNRVKSDTLFAGAAPVLGAVAHFDTVQCKPNDLVHCAVSANLMYCACTNE
jgi:hypothetical protein